MLVVAQARPSERAKFIQKTYLHLAGAVGAAVSAFMKWHAPRPGMVNGPAPHAIVALADLSFIYSLYSPATFASIFGGDAFSTLKNLESQAANLAYLNLAYLVYMGHSLRKRGTGALGMRV